jgi:hypothetical protein
VKRRIRRACIRSTGSTGVSRRNAPPNAVLE